MVEHLNVNTVILSKQGEISENYINFMKLIKEKNINIIEVEEGEKIHIDSYVYIDILFPKQKLISDNILNNNSIVAKLVYNNFSILFTGDIEELAEKELIEEIKRKNYSIETTVLKVAHHGSKTSSTQALLEQIKPKIALIGVGENNTFGHPSKEVLNRLEKIGSKIYRTDLCGEVSIRVNKKRKYKDKYTNKIEEFWEKSII